MGGDYHATMEKTCSLKELPGYFTIFICCALGDIIRSVIYVDDTKLYISAEPNDAVAIDLITTYLLAINK